jgi:hypothetical protein
MTKIDDDYLNFIDINSISAALTESDINSELDRHYNSEIKKHRNRLLYLDHVLACILHPVCVGGLLATLFILFMLFRFAGKFYDCTAADMTAECLLAVLTYIGCSFITYVITNLVGKNNRRH